MTKGSDNLFFKALSSVVLVALMVFGTQTISAKSFTATAGDFLISILFGFGDSGGGSPSVFSTTEGDVTAVSGADDCESDGDCQDPGDGILVYEENGQKNKKRP